MLLGSLTQTIVGGSNITNVGPSVNITYSTHRISSLLGLSLSSQSVDIAALASISIDCVGFVNTLGLGGITNISGTAITNSAGGAISNIAGGAITNSAGGAISNIAGGAITNSSVSIFNTASTIIDTAAFINHIGSANVNFQTILTA
jgi:hypothetical protein